MKIGIIGSRTLTIDNLGDFLPDDVTEIISGGAKGIDTCAQKYAEEHGIKMTVFKPNYEKFGRAAPVFRNSDIVAHSEKVIAFWDGESKGTRGALKICKQLNIPYDIYLCDGDVCCHLDRNIEHIFLEVTNFDRAVAENLFLRLTEDDCKE